MATLYQFYETRTRYIDFIDYKKPLSFEEWMNLNPDQKVALLFVQFYDQITLAWDKANNGYDFIDSEDGVSTMCQYLRKNVSIIEKHPERFTPAYIYRVAYNCLYCICHDRKCDKDRWEYETSAIVIVDGKEVNLMDTMSSGSVSASEDYARMRFKTEFWRVIEDAGLSAEKVLNYLLSQNEADLKKVNPRSKSYATDPLRDVEVSLEDMKQIIEDLRRRFMNLPDSSFCKDYVNKLIPNSI